MAAKKKSVGAAGAAPPRIARSGNAAYPRDALAKVLRIPKGILEQNAGKPCTDEQAAKFVGVALSGGVRMEIASAIKYGLLDRQSTGLVVTDIAKRIIRPKDPTERTAGMLEAVLKAPGISEVYKHYRGENLPDDSFFENALSDQFGIPRDKVKEFRGLFLATLKEAELLDDTGGTRRVLDVSYGPSGPGVAAPSAAALAKASKKAGVTSGDTCFVMMPFAPPFGGYYEQIYKAAIVKAGLTPVRADSDIFGTGKIIDQIWRGINDAKVLVAELTSKNANVFYELGLAHALEKPVVLVSANQQDVPFDVRHIRVIYYDVNDPFWGSKLVDKVAENILSALSNPEEATFKTLLTTAATTP